MLLTPAFRSLSRPSSPYSSQASAIDLYSLDHIVSSASFPFFPSFAVQGLFIQASLPSHSSIKTDFPSSRIYPSSEYIPLYSSFLRYFKKLQLKQINYFNMGQTRVELVTPALSERCSNQLSYCPLCWRIGGSNP